MEYLEVFLAAYHAFEASALSWVSGLIATYGGLGVLVGMFFESSIIPIPSEAVLLAAGALGLDPITVAIYGAIGSTLGATVGYLIGLKGGRPVVQKIGPWLHFNEDRLKEVEAFANKHGTWGVLLARLIPIIPFKVFSIAAGITKIAFWPFLLFTFIGTIPRAFVLAWAGAEIAKIQNGFLIIGAVVLLIVIGWYWYHQHKKRKKQKTV